MSQTHPASLGIDVAKAKFDAALLRDGKLAQRTFAMDPAGFAAVDRWIGEQGVEQVHACLEATGEYGVALALALHEAGHLVSIVNPARIAAYAKSRLARTKTDKSDAALLAHFGAREQPPIWSPPAGEVQELQALVRRVEMLQEMVQRAGESPAEWRLLQGGAGLNRGHPRVPEKGAGQDQAPGPATDRTLRRAAQSAAAALLDSGSWLVDGCTGAGRDSGKCMGWWMPGNWQRMLA